jgi:hypothetical protein
LYPRHKRRTLFLEVGIIKGNKEGKDSGSNRGRDEILSSSVDKIPSGIGSWVDECRGKENVRKKESIGSKNGMKTIHKGRGMMSKEKRTRKGTVRNNENLI